MSIGSLTSIQQGTLLANEVRAVIAKHLGVDIERVTDDAHFKDDLERGNHGDQFDQIEVVGDLIRCVEEMA